MCVAGRFPRRGPSRNQPRRRAVDVADLDVTTGAVGPPDHPVPPQDRHRVVAQHPLGHRRIRLEPVLPAPHLAEASPVPYQRVERCEEPHPRRRVRLDRGLIGRPHKAGALDVHRLQLTTGQQIPDHRQDTRAPLRRAQPPDHEVHRRAQAGLRHRRQDPRDPQHDRAQPLLRINRVTQRRRHLVAAHPADPIGNPQVSVVPQPFQIEGRRRGRTTPPVGDTLVPEMGLHVAWMRHPALAHERQHVGHPARHHEPAVRSSRITARVQVATHPAGDKTVGVEHVLIDVQRRIQPVEITGPVTTDALP